MKIGRQWTRDELVLAVALYCQTPFGKIHNKNDKIINLSQKINRTPSSVAMKMVNFASLDPTLHQRGMSNHSKLDAEVWAEFFEDTDKFIETSKKICMNYLYNQKFNKEYEFPMKEGRDYNVFSKSRGNQDFFRGMILSSYDNKCAITGINLPDLLVASHIIPWSSNKKTRVDPRNGICLNALHDKAFDKGYISFCDDFLLIISKAIPDISRSYFDPFEGKKINLPKRFLPSREFLRYHRENIFIK